ncbi:major facilitator super transporter protein [Exophiala dermatitidis]|uniref:GPI ethanolamine phosphate transferase 2 n=1 Tax=Exophiala dermatitidis TaxID=5970 RepID=A0AAN6F2Q7_EXODE|nr:major facilitator super transporter protein [Exophiala dermatitidis]KAJ4528270.1 major facilitator super transporter protein [Exophiala dermatitidis]KAJ4531213.1 major facilitator super transporter protein [Exophiala dermatitidis]KAJ4558378.1 major facilitator super transporter protein [Exophiala dermatitidis]KAJ4581586.1 major facilitator super transporter protein [Exophiala dermatitidis]
MHLQAYGRASIALANILLLAALLVFAKGFFPHKAFLPGLATRPQDLDNGSQSAPFDRVIFMVVDALRSDFVYSDASSFAFTQGLIRSGAAVPFTGHASAPTITMPRVKAITTGSVPSFVDLILNFAESDTTSTLKDQDSWLAQLKARGDKLVMYGDDTWLRLFPDFFDRADGTTSFFVSDFTEVDNNVTRHIPRELEQQDWSAMTLHFLGLDHIGHKTGPKGPNMRAKQGEMDGIVRQIYTAMETNEHLKSCLLVVLGDHGMNEGGNHGASSPGEVSTALTFISPKFQSAFEGQTSPFRNAIDYKYYQVIQQSDIVPTLAALLGFPIPLNNLGVIIPRLLELWTVQQDQYNLLFENAQQIHRIARATFPSTFVDRADSHQDCSKTTGDDADILACLWKQVLEDRDADIASSSSIANLRTFLYKAQTVLSGTASNYDLASMRLGIGLGLIALSLCLPNFINGIQKYSYGNESFALLLIMTLYAVTMFASSYVEEEHQFWYWILGAWLIILCCKDGRYAAPPANESARSGGSSIQTALAFLLFGVVRRWRQTGQKYAGGPDLLSELVTPYPWLLWTLVVLTYVQLTVNLSQKTSTWVNVRQMGLLPVLVSISAFLFKIAFTAADAPELLQDFPLFDALVGFVSRYPLVNLARVVFIGLAHLLLCAIYYETPWKSARHLASFLTVFQDVLSIFLATQSRTVYIPLYLFFNLQLSLLRRGRRYSTGEVTILSLLFQYLSFFAMGGTNSIATIDLSNAYNGVSGYNVVAVGVLTFVSNWAASIWWAFAVCQLLVDPEGLNNGHSGFLLMSLSTFACVHTIAVMVACTVLREHLFIWTVFSPKYLYTAAWIVGQHIVINSISVGALLWHSST